MKKLTRNLLVAASFALAGGISIMAHAQSETPAATDTAGNRQQSRAQQLMGGIAPKLAELTDGVLYGDIWERPQLKRDRSLVTVAALIALNRPDQLRSHLALARQNGVTEEELVGTITHLAFYAGWPNSVTAVSVARKSSRRTDDISAMNRKREMKSFAAAVCLALPRRFDRLGSVWSDDHGHVRDRSRPAWALPMLHRLRTCRFTVPGAGSGRRRDRGVRTRRADGVAYHPLGQTLYITSGCGWVQSEGGPVREVRPGDIVQIPPNVRHWHGASAGEAMAHLAVAESLDGSRVTWMEHVSDADYAEGAGSSRTCAG